MKKRISNKTLLILVGGAWGVILCCIAPLFVYAIVTYETPVVMPTLYQSPTSTQSPIILLPSDTPLQSPEIISTLMPIDTFIPTSTPSFTNTPLPTITLTFTLTPTPTFTFTPTPTRTLTKLAPTITSAPVCNCSGDLYNCDDFPGHNAAQACFNYCKSLGYGDVHHLDGDGDGQVCE